VLDEVALAEALADEAEGLAGGGSWGPSRTSKRSWKVRYICVTLLHCHTRRTAAHRRSHCRSDWLLRTACSITLWRRVTTSLAKWASDRSVIPPRAPRMRRKRIKRAAPSVQEGTSVRRGHVLKDENPKREHNIVGIWGYIPNTIPTVQRI
jgi:hypothetical protein